LSTETLVNHLIIKGFLIF